MSEEKWRKEWRDIGIIREIKTEVTRKTANDSIIQHGASLYLLFECKQVEAACERFGIGKEDLREFLMHQQLRAIGENKLELVFTFLFPSDPMKKVIPK